MLHSLFPVAPADQHWLAIGFLRQEDPEAYLGRARVVMPVRLADRAYPIKERLMNIAGVPSGSVFHSQVHRDLPRQMVCPVDEKGSVR